MAYATRTGTRRNLAALEGAGWRLLATPDTLDRYKWPAPTWADGAPAPFALDNGAWGAHQKGQVFPDGPFRRALALLGGLADWIVVPDVVCGGLDSLRFSMQWLPLVRAHGPALLAVQNGMTPADLEPIVGPEVGLAVGGDDAFKLATLPAWGNLAAKTGCHLHVLRVNTARRIQLCHQMGAHSFDGTSASRWAVNVPRLTRAKQQPTRQLTLLGGLPCPTL